MSHPIHRVTRLSIVGPYTLAVAFADSMEQRSDFTPVLHGMLFGPLPELATFNAVTLHAEAGTLVWPNGADFDPATLHDWPDERDELAARARAWAEPSSDQRANGRMEPTRDLPSIKWTLPPNHRRCRMPLSRDGARLIRNR